MSTDVPWIALAAGVVGVGAAALSERSGSASTRYTPDFFWTQIVPSATRLAADEGAPILVTFNDRFNAWGMVNGKQQPRTRNLFAVIDAKGHLEHGPAWDASFDRGSAAVDPVKRYRDLQRVASPSSGATANERAMAQRLLAKMTPPAPQRQAPRTPSSGGYRYDAGPVPPWQTDKRSFFNDIYRNDFTDLNFALKSIYEHASVPRLKVSLHGFDGYYGRSIFTAFSSLDDLGYAAEVLEAWGDSHFKKDGVFDAVIGVVGGPGSDVRVLRIRGEDVSGLGLTLDHDSFNLNPFNDTSFADRLRALVLKHRGGSRAVIPRARVKFGPYRPPSLEEIRIALRPLGMKVRREEGEFRVVFDDFDATPRGELDEEMAAYYTLDAEDALETARNMARRRGQVDF